MINIRATHRFIMHFKSLDKNQRILAIQELALFRKILLILVLILMLFRANFQDYIVFLSFLDLRILFRFIKKINQKFSYTTLDHTRYINNLKFGSRRGERKLI